MAKREQYSRNIRDFYNNFDVIKVIKGVRKAGKSVLLKQKRGVGLRHPINN